MKKLHDHTVDKLSRDLLHDYSEEAPVGAFDSILIGLQNKKKEKRKRIIFYIAASWAVLISFGLGYVIKSFDNKNTNVIAESKKHLESVSIVKDKSISLNVQAIQKQLKSVNNNLKQISSNTITVPEKSDVIDSSLFAMTSTVILKTNFRKNKNTITFDSTNVNNNGSSILISNSIINDKYDINTKSNGDSIVLTHNDSLRLLYKYITMSSSATHTSDTAVIENEIIKNNEAIYLASQEIRNDKWTIVGGFTSMRGFDVVGNSNSQSSSNQFKSNNDVSKDDKELIANLGNKGEVVNNHIDVGNSEDNNKMSIAFSTGIAVKRSLSEKWNIRTGVNYNKISESNKDISYVEVPLITEYRLLNKTLKIYFTNGVGAGFKESNIHPIGVSGFSLLYPISKMVNVNLEPSYKHVFGRSWEYKADYYGLLAGLSVTF